VGGKGKPWRIGTEVCVNATSSRGWRRCARCWARSACGWWRGRGIEFEITNCDLKRRTRRTPL